MTTTRKQIDWMRSHGRMRIDADLEGIILAQYGEEPDGPEYTEQDLHEQIRKLVHQYNREHPVSNLAVTPTSWAGNDSSITAASRTKEDEISK